jgi:hypothetical protein
LRRKLDHLFSRRLQTLAARQGFPRADRSRRLSAMPPANPDPEGHAGAGQPEPKAAQKTRRLGVSGSRAP